MSNFSTEGTVIKTREISDALLTLQRAFGHEVRISVSVANSNNPKALATALQCDGVERVLSDDGAGSRYVFVRYLNGSAVNIVGELMED